ncbi:gamma-butyrobetaine hydroxylase-like domain-containing protein, partial [Candidatus Venteria ishoeyi]
MALTTPVPTEIEYHQQSRMLNIRFGDAQAFEFSAEFLRVYSPSAEVRGHSEDEAVLQIGKADVKIEKIEPVGNYAIVLHFDDGHDTGIYSWEWLYHLGVDQDTLWADYLK